MAENNTIPTQSPTRYAANAKIWKVGTIILL